MWGLFGPCKARLRWTSGFYGRVTTIGEGRAEFHHGNDTLANSDGDGLLEIVATDQSDKLMMDDFDGEGRDEHAIKHWHSC